MLTDVTLNYAFPQRLTITNYPARIGMTAVIGGHMKIFLILIDSTPLRLAYIGFMKKIWI
jgi:hypothetical protein